MNIHEKTRVWDPFIRLFHWTLVAAIALAALTGYLLGARWIDAHVLAGVTALALVGTRLLWGFWGTGYARFASFVKGPQAALEHLRTGHRSLGHNPLGGWMVLALLAIIVAIAITGVAVLGGVFHAGPAGSWLSVAQGFGAREVHETLATLLLFLIVAHIGGVIFESRRSGENLTRAMITGSKQARPGDRVQPPARAHPLRTALTATGAIAALAAGSAALSRGLPAAAPVDLQGTAYQSACSECHIAYHPSLLPAESWQVLMGGLTDHFGEDASLPAPEIAALTQWLTAHDSTATDSLPARFVGRPTRPAVIAITETAGWKRIHDDLPDGAFSAPPVYTRANCAACHSDAASGWFYPGNIDVPTQTKTTTRTN